MKDTAFLLATVAALVVACLVVAGIYRGLEKLLYFFGVI